VFSRINQADLRFIEQNNVGCYHRMMLFYRDSKMSKQMNIKIDPYECAFQEFLKLKNIDFDRFPEKYQRLAGNLGAQYDFLPRCVPTKFFENWKSKLIASIKMHTKNEKDDQYLSYLVEIKKVLSALQPAIVNNQSLENASEPLKSRLSSLRAIDGNFHASIKYSNANSVTGRLTVVSGPNVLTMPADYKKFLESRFRDGSIIQIDLIAAEPTIALNVAGKTIAKDPYNELNEQIFGSSLERNDCKRIVLCALYGQSKRKLSNAMGKNFDVDEAVESTKNYFDYQNLINFIRKNADDEFLIRNFFGRPIPIQDRSDSLTISYFLQSTAAEAAVLAFGELLRRTKDHCVPLHIIHDAIIVDCKNDYAKFLLSKQQLKLRMNNWMLPAKVTLIN
jgi:hypothetical protein